MLEKDIRDRIALPYKDNAYNAYSTCFANTAHTGAYMLHIPSFRVPRKKFLIRSLRSRGTLNYFQMGAGGGYILKTIRAPGGPKTRLISSANTCCPKLRYVTRLLGPWMRCVDPESHCLRSTRSNVWNLASLNIYVLQIMVTRLNWFAGDISFKNFDAILDVMLRHFGTVIWHVKKLWLFWIFGFAR